MLIGFIQLRYPPLSSHCDAACRCMLISAVGSGMELQREAVNFGNRKTLRLFPPERDTMCLGSRLMPNVHKY